MALRVGYVLGLGKKPLAQKGTNLTVGAFQCRGAGALADFGRPAYV